MRNHWWLDGIRSTYIKIDLLECVVEGVSLAVDGRGRQRQFRAMRIHVIETHALRNKSLWIPWVLGRFVHQKPKMTNNWFMVKISSYFADFTENFIVKY